MAASALNRIVQHLRDTALRADGGALTDGQLLERFVSRRDTAALEMMVQRHAGMVWGVCRRILGHHQDAEDALQATFLVLVRRAATVVPREMIANWLYGVARQTALKARATRAKRRDREKQVATMPEPEAEQQSDVWSDLLPVFDEELSRLPEKYRVALVLCDLESKTRREAARQLGCPDGTLAARLARARALLAKRLAQRGLAVSAGTVAAVVAQQAAGAAPAAIVSATIRAVTLVAAGQAAASVTSIKVALLMEGVLKTMCANKLLNATALLLAAVLVVGSGGIFYQTQAVEPGSQGAQAATSPKEPAKDAGSPQAKADIDAAAAALKVAEANLAQAKAQLALKQGAYQKALAKALPFEKEKFQAAASQILSQFTHRLPVELGLTQQAGNAHIEIQEVWGTQPEFVVGGFYLVHGKYTLPKGMRGKLYFWETVTEGSGIAPGLDLQSTAAEGSGEFTLLHHMGAPGYFHLYLAAPQEGQATVYYNVYFGTGKTVYREDK